jgi:hypothetical protein
VSFRNLDMQGPPGHRGYGGEVDTEELSRVGQLIPGRWRRLRARIRVRHGNWGLSYVPSRSSLDFKRGVEFGLLYARVRDYGGAEWCVHADMTELVMRLAESRGLPFSSAPHEHGPECGECTGRSDCKDGGDWLDVTIGWREQE